MRRFYYIGHVLPYDKVDLAWSVNNAVNNNEVALVESLANIDGDCGVVVFTLVPMASWPKSKQLFVHKTKMEFDQGFHTLTIPYVNVPIVKQIGVITALFCMLNKSIMTDQGKGFSRFCLVNINAHAFFSIPVHLVARIYNCRTICFLVDNVVEKRMKTTSKFKATLNRIDNIIACKLFPKYDGVIAYSLASVRQHSTDTPCLEILHVANENVAYHEHVHQTIDKEVVISFTGSLTEFNGIKHILGIMDYLPDNYVLNICGVGEMRGYVVDKARQDKRIRYHGFVSNDDAITIQKRSHLLLLIRSMDNDDQKYLAKYAVSGKLPEYLASGVPVIANEIPAIPKQFREFLNLMDRYDSEHIAKEILRYTKDDQTYDSLLEKSRKGQNYALEHCTMEAQSTKIREFVDEIC